MLLVLVQKVTVFDFFTLIITSSTTHDYLYLLHSLYYFSFTSQQKLLFSNHFSTISQQKLQYFFSNLIFLLDPQLYQNLISLIQFPKHTCILFHKNYCIVPTILKYIEVYFIFTNSFIVIILITLTLNVQYIYVQHILLAKILFWYFLC